MKVLFFGKLKEITKKSEMEIKGIKDLSELKSFLYKKFPEIEREIFFIAVNQKICDGDTDLKEEDEIAFLPPISGG
ncbi:MAG: MoaD/ThiS family protein [Candidatus Omnitrophica bacterium]|nr:MoaD/ThiS family protein [Candidatus Omnitrophota bacterium]